MTAIYLGMTFSMGLDSDFDFSRLLSPRAWILICGLAYLHGLDLTGSLSRSGLHRYLSWSGFHRSPSRSGLHRSPSQLSRVPLSFINHLFLLLLPLYFSSSFLCSSAAVRVFIYRLLSPRVYFIDFTPQDFALAWYSRHDYCLSILIGHEFYQFVLLHGVYCDLFSAQAEFFCLIHPDWFREFVHRESVGRVCDCTSFTMSASVWFSLTALLNWLKKLRFVYSLSLSQGTYMVQLVWLVLSVTRSNS